MERKLCHALVSTSLMSLQLIFVFAPIYQEVQQLLQQVLDWSHHMALGTVTTWVSGTELVLTSCFCGCF